MTRAGLVRAGLVRAGLLAGRLLAVGSLAGRLLAVGSLAGRLLAVGSLVGAPPAWALPAPVLGPDGPLHVGTLVPAQADPRGVAVVDPVSGELALVLPGAAGRFAWEEGTWTLDGEPLAAGDAVEIEDPLERLRYRPEGEAPAPAPDLRGREVVPEGARWTWGEAGLLSLVDPQGGLTRVVTDAQGRPRGVAWPDGTRLEVQRDEFGRVVRMAGPGPGLLQLAWRDGGLQVVDPLGAPLVVRPGPGQRDAVRSVVVIDAVGRQVRAFYGPDPLGRERLLGWEEPRGLTSWVRYEPRAVSVVDGAGRSWRAELDPAGRVQAVLDPGAARWTWRRDAQGRVIGVEDPAGRIHAWARDQEGRLVGVGRGAVPWRLRRDVQGRLVEVADPVGATVTLVRDPAGRIVRITDPAGGETSLARGRAGTVETVATAGGRWRLDLDLLGRVARVTGPDARRWELQRDAAGRLTLLRDPVRGSFALDRGASGALTRLRGPAGDAVGLARDALGRLQALRWPGGEEVSVRRDAAGEVVELRRGPWVVGLQRDASEEPVRAGAVQWRRDGAGRVRELLAPGRAWRVERDGAGLVRAVQAGDWSVTVGRDRAGRVVRWSGTDGEVEARRDPAGRITREQVRLPAPPQAQTTAEVALEEAVLAPVPAAAAALVPALDLSWDPRGRLQTLALEARTWRLLRDAAGRLLRVVGPEGIAVGVDRDEAGRVTLVRHPAHSLLRLTWLPDGLRLALEDSGGRRLAARALTLDAGDRVVALEEQPWGALRLRRDGRGRVVALERDGGAGGWRVAEDGQVEGGDGSRVQLDPLGRALAARPPAGAPAWGVGGATLAYAWDDEGRLAWVAGELGAARLEHDALGRLVGLSPEVGDPWTLRYDARGRLAQIEQGGRVLHTLAWGPAVDDGPQSLLASGPRGEATWAPGPWGPAGLRGPEGDGGLVDRVGDPAGAPWWWLREGGAAGAAGVDPRGYPATGTGDPWGADLPGPAGGLQPFPGGPVLALAPAEGGAVPGGAALDPATGQRTDGLAPWPWAGLAAGVEAGAWADGGPQALDPAPWSATGPWQAPLRLLVALGELEDPVGGAWTALPAPGPALPWLPASLDRADPPLGPPLDALPLGEDVLTTSFVLAALPGAAPADPDRAARALVAAELDLPWLPPGVALPLPWPAGAGDARPLPAARN
ncbi:hypothetical protein L6R53_23065 [Myxococcota bacterium]|nr:hypothetical protein [Myxococcota bacterium]